MNKTGAYIPFGKPDFGDEEIAAVTRVLRSGWIGQGPEALEFEKELAQYIDIPHVVTVNSCTSALFLSLVVSGVKAGDEVIVPSLTWCSTANAVLYCGARPIFCDVDSETLCVTGETVAAQLTPRTKAVIVVHMGGMAADVDAIRQALPPEVVIIEDAAHALGGRYSNGSMVGASGNLACFSFYANKNLSTGEGGAVALADRKLAARMQSLRLHALPTDAWKRFTAPELRFPQNLEELGYKMNYTDLQAAIGRVQLRRMPELQARRYETARRYAKTLGKIEGVRLQAGVLEPRHARHLFLVQLPVQRLKKSRDDIIMDLRCRNVGASLHYVPLHQMPLYQTQVSLPVTEEAALQLLTLPIGPCVGNAEADYICEQVLDVLESAGMK